MLTPLFQNNVSALCITDPEARFVYGNRAFLNLLEKDLSSDSLNGLQLHDMFPHSKRVITLIETVVSSSISGSFHKILHPHNTEINVHIDIHPLIDQKNNELNGALITLNTDADWLQKNFDDDKQILTSRIKQLSSDVIDKQTLIKLFLEKSPFGIALIDNNRNIIQINRAAENILGISRSRAIGLPCSRIFPCYEQNMGCPVIDGNQNIDREESTCFFHNKLKSTVLRSVILSRERNEEIILEAFVDISDIKEAQKAKEDAYRAKDEFFAKMSHELRTPLNAVIGLSEIINSDVDNISKKELLKYSSAIHHAGYDLLHLVDQVLNISKLDSNKFENHPLEIHPKPIIDEVATLIRPLAEKNHNQFLFNSDIKFSTLYADPDHLRQILLNLLSNACKFTHNGEITLGGSREESADGIPGVSFFIHDTGIGLSEEEIGRIFEKFEQADKIKIPGASPLA